MPDRTSSAAEPDSSSDSVVGPLRGKRRRLDELLAAQRLQLATLERAVNQQIERTREELVQARETSEAVVDTTEHERQREALAAEAASLAQLSEELEVRNAKLLTFENELKDQERLLVERLSAEQADLDERAADLDAASQQLRQAQRSLAIAEEELAADRHQNAKIRERLDEQTHTLEREREQLSALRSETNNQRRRIARELDQQRKTQKAELAKQQEAIRAEREQVLAECQRRRDELQNLQACDDVKLQSDFASLKFEAEQLREQLAEQKKLIAARSAELAAARDELASATRDVSRLQAECERLTAEVSITHNAAVPAENGEERRQLEEELAALRLKLAEAESKATAPAASEAETRKREDLQRRFELAVEDIRDLKRRNAQLEEQLAHGGQSAGTADSSGKLDWESQKKRLLASLEADSDETEEQAQDRISIEGTIRITDEIVARKDQEIHELKRVLDEQSSNLGAVAVGASAIADMLDQDGLVQQERDKLAKLQEEWREKLRQAEIDISVERAKMARERAELDEKLQSIAADRARNVSKDGDGGHDSLTKSGERRWWARLGLKETDGE